MRIDSKVGVVAAIAITVASISIDRGVHPKNGPPTGSDIRTVGNADKKSRAIGRVARAGIMSRDGQNPKPAGVEIIDYGWIKKTVRSAWETTKKIGKRLGAEEITVLVEDLNGGVDHANNIKGPAATPPSGGMEPVKPTPGKLGSEFRAPETLFTAVPALVEPKFAGFEFGELDDLTIDGATWSASASAALSSFARGFVVGTAWPASASCLACLPSLVMCRNTATAFCGGAT